MELNKKIITAGLILTLLTLTASMFFIYYCRLKEPVFLQHYYENQLPVDDTPNGESAFVIYYLTNRSDKKEVTGITFKEAPEINFYATENQSGGMMVWSSNTIEQKGVVYGRYSLRSVYVNMVYDSNVEKLDKSLLSQAAFEFSDGTQMNADIGKIIFYKREPSDRYLDSFSSSGSSDGTSSVRFNVKTDISLVKIDSPFLSEADKLFHIRVDGINSKDINGIQYGIGSTLTVSGMLIPPENSIGQLCFFDIKPCIYLKTSEGNTYSERVYNFEYNTLNRNFTWLQIFKYLAARGKL